MCFIFYENTWRRIAKKTIVVWKIGMLDGKKFRPLCQNSFSYRKRVPTKKINLKIESNLISWIRKSYHSIVSWKAARELYPTFDKEHLEKPGIHCVGKFLIPAGSEYYKNNRGFIVSETIIWTGYTMSVHARKYEV